MITISIIVVVLLLYFAPWFESIDWSPKTKKKTTGGGAQGVDEKKARYDAWKIELEARERLALTVKQHLVEVANSHMSALQRKYRNLVYKDDYGVLELRFWNRELDYFCERVIRPAYEEFLAKSPVSTRFPQFEKMAEYIALRINEVLSVDDISECEFDLLDPLEFELHCASELARSGWETQQTSRSGDQGCDVIGVIDEVRLILQCKSYSKPVGNKAVQEVHAARGYYHGSHAGVVARSGFTTSAKILANSLDVILLSPEDLSSLHERLDL